jgi:hypothetical protein
MALLEWIRFRLVSPPSPWLYSAAAIIVVALAAFKLRRAINRSKGLKQGRDGERIVAEHLQTLTNAVLLSETDRQHKRSRRKLSVRPSGSPP